MDARNHRRNVPLPYPNSRSREHDFMATTGAARPADDGWNKWPSLHEVRHLGSPVRWGSRLHRCLGRERHQGQKRKLHPSEDRPIVPLAATCCWAVPGETSGATSPRQAANARVGGPLRPGGRTGSHLWKDARERKRQPGWAQGCLKTGKVEGNRGVPAGVARSGTASPLSGAQKNAQQMPTRNENTVNRDVPIQETEHRSTCTSY